MLLNLIPRAFSDRHFERREGPEDEVVFSYFSVYNKALKIEEERVILNY